MKLEATNAGFGSADARVAHVYEIQANTLRVCIEWMRKNWEHALIIHGVNVEPKD